MTPLFYFVYSIHALTMQQAPAGTELNVRLSTPLSSYATKPGKFVRGVVIAPVIRDGRVVIPQGTEVSGEVSSVSRVGYGIYHERASIGIEFKNLTLPGGYPIPVSAKLIQVDNAREKVTRNGVIQGIRSTGTITYRVSGYIRTALLWDVHAEAAEWAIKSLVVQLPEPEIYYPAGAEVVLKLDRSVTVAWPGDWVDDTQHLTEIDRHDLEALAGNLPSRTIDPETKQQSDITNVLLIGSREEIQQAFKAAGWSEAQPISLRTRIGTIRAAAEVHGFDGAPMSILLLNGAPPDLSYHKGLNDVAKRHHIRIWKQPQRWYGQDVWLAAATRDVDVAYMRPGRPFTHQIAPKVDEEREKIAYDLSFTGCAQPVMWAQRDHLPRLTHNATRDLIATDTRLAVVQMNHCDAAPETDHQVVSAIRGNKFQRFLRREIMITRNDFIRQNIYYRSYEGARWTVDYVRNRRKKASEMRTLTADYGPGGTLPAKPPHEAALSIPTFR